MKELGRLVDAWQESSPFVLYRLPGENGLHYSILEESNTQQESDGKGFVWAPFQGDPLIFRSVQPLIFEAEELKAQVDRLSKQGTLLYEHLNENPNQHIDILKSALEELQAGRLEKVVVSRIAHVKTESHPLLMLWRALQRYSNAFCYWFYHPEYGCWLGASPEVLVCTRASQFETYSLAGTQKKKGELPPQWTTKELREQAIVTEYLEEKLQTVASDIQVSGPHDAAAGQLWHLKSVLSGKTLVSGEELAQNLHPSPAICGMPAEKARHLITEIENHDRAFYTGYFGPVSNERTDLYVNLRCMQWHKDYLEIYVGGGITAESDPEKEWQETCDKMQTMLQLLQE